MTIFEVVSSVATLGALMAAIWQLGRSVADGRARDESRRVERALELYQDVVSEGETHEAFHRLSLLLRRIGAEKYGLTTWQTLSDSDLEAGGHLDPNNHEREKAYADLYSVLWFFERCKVSLDRGLVSRDTLMVTIGFHFWWWGRILRDLHAPKSAKAIHDLANEAMKWSTDHNVVETWFDACAHDFNGGGWQDFQEVQ